MILIAAGWINFVFIELDFDGNDEVAVDDDGPGIIEDDIGDEDELLPNLDDKDEN